MSAQLQRRSATPPRPARNPGAARGPLWLQPGLQELLDQRLPVSQRLPDLRDENRWVDVQLGDRVHRLAQPITFTPYASAQPCSARCRFCSEALRPDFAGPIAAKLRPGPGYFQGLATALSLLTAVPLSWSLSGLESTDDIDWMLQLLGVLSAAESAGLSVESRVLYSNLAGFSGTRAEALIQALHSFGLGWIEVSRHHHDGARNQAIMRFRDGLGVVDNDGFRATVRKLDARLRYKLVCVVQRGGVDSVDELLAYLDWALAHGAEQVIFRELARMDGAYLPNSTSRYVAQQRIDIGDLLARCLQRRAFADRWLPRRVTRGYYFSNIVLAEEGGREIVFEAADYGDMHQRHDSDRVYKLIYFANGELAADWQPGRRTLWTFDG
ncbi:hypothetical protein [Pseudomarimonas arenosa]|uniref:hypothetical protein n=1 Tax=Pseudomarimonas arenosa TaxID=2774145 RepID=UPI001CDD721A|nr:hypothetical protein [Pseudomarimonas arenosa]